MARKQQTRKRVKGEDVAGIVSLTFSEMEAGEEPINWMSLHKATGISRTTLYKYIQEDEVAKAEQRRLANHSADPEKVHHRLGMEERVRRLEKENEALKQQNAQLAENWLKMVQHAQLNGIDMELLLQPLTPKPGKRVR